MWEVGGGQAILRFSMTEGGGDFEEAKIVWRNKWTVPYFNLVFFALDSLP